MKHIITIVLLFAAAAVSPLTAQEVPSADDGQNTVKIDPIADPVADAKIQPIKGGFYVEWPALATVGGVKLPPSAKGKFEVMFDIKPDAVNTKPSQADDPVILLPLADYWIVRGKPEHAIKLYRKGLEKDPDNFMFQNNLAMLVSRVEGDNKQALDIVNKALTDRHDNITLLDSKGLILINDGRADEAVPVLERAVELSCQHPIYCLHLSKALDMAGREDQSKNWFDKMRPLLEAMPGKLVKENKDMFDELRIKFAN
ncbi:MAG: hypothetical protein LBN39_06400 [Planctomycetaceae bacterium]|jgi:tetratricopeptide (TPR) repeat protein|nr:hypothetical protein [Planctomycetaceae bacterium]